MELEWNLKLLTIFQKRKAGQRFSDERKLMSEWK
jgi:hypothetical protein